MPTYAYPCIVPNPDAVPIVYDNPQDSDLEEDVDAADTSSQTLTTADPSYQSHGVKSMERGGFTSRVRSVVVMVKQRELHGRLEEVIQLPGASCTKVAYAQKRGVRPFPRSRSDVQNVKLP